MERAERIAAEVGVRADRAERVAVEPGRVSGASWCRARPGRSPSGGQAVVRGEIKASARAESGATAILAAYAALLQSVAHGSDARVRRRGRGAAAAVTSGIRAGDQPGAGVWRKIGAIASLVVRAIRHSVAITSVLERVKGLTATHPAYPR
ncbi:hypothetical protein GCM10010116_28840 [Microbispora rosea subsp. aerata]|nr:hypothetical protein GCM10010116_28840 [Microbispora rosea subsp. aerata]GIH55500.1 hypothetical protein Mro02_24140 [Microbispora rosea subsp. aerata]GLJ87197.1 hypothetical protein GCM10017588_59410 [Microbispora rosea subsp. aerata]